MYTTDPDNATLIELVATEDLAGWRDAQSDLARSWLAAHTFEAAPGQLCWLPDDDGTPVRVALGWDGKHNIATLGGLPEQLPAGRYQVSQPLEPIALAGWGLGCYRFTRYKSATTELGELVVPAADEARVRNLVSSATLARNLINTPADHMLPSHLSAEMAKVASAFDAEFTEVIGDDLLAQGYRTIHAVGRAADDAPRLLELTWGQPDHPKVTLVGKGVCFDSGGLDIKPSSGMRWMKKDMGGAAAALGLAELVMAEQLPVRLRVLIPAVENAISGNAYRPGDVIETYQGTTVEIDNTDAEGRLVMCDALTLACEEEVDLLVDFATLTGSARSAVGAEIAAMFASRDETAEAIYRHGVANDDAVWRMPLHDDYAYMLSSKVADTVNSAASPYAGSVTAALFLKKFVSVEDWVHFDLMAFNTRARPGRPEGGEAMALRAVFGHLEARYG